MKIYTVLALLLICLQACTAQPAQRKVTYTWLGLEVIPKNSHGEISGAVQSDPPHSLKHPGNEFTFYGKDDSIFMNIPTYQGDLFKKTAITAKRWKPVAQYGAFYFLNTYTNDELPGMYMSFYVTKDRKSLMELHYTNPGNLISIMIFASDSASASTKGIVDATKEIPEPEEAVISFPSKN